MKGKGRNDEVAKVNKEEAEGRLDLGKIKLPLSPGSAMC